jgi:lambda repressor-like predicted transcriptional regulator
MRKIRLCVKEVAKEKGISMSMLSHHALLSLNTVRRIYHEPYSPVYTDTLVRIANALDVPVKDLFEEEESE